MFKRDKPIKDSCRVQSGFAFPSSAFQDTGIPVIRMSDLKTGNLDFKTTNFVSSTWIDTAQDFALHDGDFLIGMSGSLSNFAHVKSSDLPALLNQRVGRLIIKDKLNANYDFICFCLKSDEYKLYAEIEGEGAAQKNISAKQIENFRYWNLPYNEQVKVAYILNKADTAIKKTQALIAKYENIKQGMMQDLFSRGVDENGQLRPSYEDAPHLYQETELGWLPNDWKVDLLDSLAQRGSGHTPSKSFPEYWNGGIKWVSLADSWRLDDLYIDDTDYRISQAGIANSSAVVHRAGIVVLSRDAGIGKSAITTEPMAVSQHFMCWTCGSKMDNHFLYYWMQLNKPLFESIAMGSTILTIGLSFFKRLKIACPSNLDEMQKIGEKLKASDIKLKSLKSELEKLKSIKRGLMQDLLTGKVLVAEDIEERKEAVA